MEAVKQFFYSLYTAFMGVVYVVRVERNARLHLVFAVAALLLCVILGVNSTELAAIFLAILLVVTAEIVNTALEKTLDLIEPQHNERIRVVKDIAAGAVLVSAIGALAIGAAVFTPYIVDRLWRP